MRHLFHPGIRLSLYLDGLLTSGQIERVERHLAECESCRQTCERMARLRGVLRKTPSAPVAPSFVNTVMRRYRQQMAPNSFWAAFQSMPSLLPQLALLVILLLALLWNLPGGNPDVFDRVNIHNSTTAALEQVQIDTSLVTYDQVLQFALSERSEGGK